MSRFANAEKFFLARASFDLKRFLNSVFNMYVCTYIKQSHSTLRLFLKAEISFEDKSQGFFIVSCFHYTNNLTTMYLRVCSEVWNKEMVALTELLASVI